METPSLAMIPANYGVGKLYSQLPSTSNVGDFTVVRDSSATRVNKDGYIELVDANVARLDYSDGGCPKLLTEPESENLITQSNVFDMLSGDQDGTKEEITISNGIEGISMSVTNGREWKYQTINTTIGEDYTLSFYLDEFDLLQPTTVPFAVTFGDSLSVHEALSSGVVTFATDVVSRPPGVNCYKDIEELKMLITERKEVNNSYKKVSVVKDLITLYSGENV